MSFLGDLFSPVQDTWNTLATLPGSPEAAGDALYGGVNGDLSWNPYSQDNSVWDTGAGGTSLSQDPNNRRYGRAIGTAIGAAFTGGALGAAYGGGAGAGASTAADYSLASGAGNALGDYAGSTASLGAGTGATSGAAGGASLGTAAGGAGGATAGNGLAEAAQRGAVRGAITNAGNTAANGGNGSDILKSGALGGIYGGAGGGVDYGISNYNPGSSVTDNPYGQKVINSGLSSGTKASLNGGSFKTGALTGAGSAGGNMAFNGLGNMWLSGNTSPSADSDLGGGVDTSYQNYGTSGFTPPVQTTDVGPTDMGGQQNPLKRFVPGSTNQFSLDSGVPANTPGASLGFQGVSPNTGPNGFGTPPAAGGNNPNMMSNLLGLYSAYKQHQANSQLQGNLASMYGQDSPYAQQLKQQLARTAAASGRRSDVGSQVVALQAALAHGNSQNAPQIMQLNNANANGMNAGLNNLYQLGQGTGANQAILNGGRNLWDQYSPQLSNLFSGGQ